MLQKYYGYGLLGCFLDFHRRAKSYETSTPDLTSLKLYSPEKKKSFDFLLDYDYTGAGELPGESSVDFFLMKYLERLLIEMLLECCWKCL